MLLNLFIIIISIVRRNFFLVWVIIEVSLISFIGIILYSESNKKQGRFGRVIYFSANIVTSIIVLALFLIRSNNFISLNLMEIYLLIKLAVAPYYYYIISISGRIRLFLLYWVLTFQKIIPFRILWELPIDRVSLIIGLIVRIIDCLRVGLGKIKTLIVWSRFSRNWLILTIDYVGFFIGLEYLLTFWFCLTGLIIIIFRELNSINFSDRFIKYYILIRGIGLPPTGMFIIKIIIITNLLEQNIIFLCLFLLRGQVVIVKILIYFLKIDLIRRKLRVPLNLKFI